MDIVTHGLLGATVAQAGFSKRFPGKAAFYGFLLGLIPDLDVISSLFGPWISLKFHRGPLHSLLLLTLLTFPIAWLGKKISKSDERISVWRQLAFICIITHPIIDWFTSYGTLLFWPLTTKRFALDSLSIIDPFFSFPLLISTFFGFLTYADPNKKKHLAIVALILSFGYNSFGYLNSQSSIDFARNQLIHEKTEFKELRATPTFFNILLYRIIVKTNEKNYKIAYLNVLNRPEKLYWTDYSSEQNQLVKKAFASEKGKLFNWFSMGYSAAKTVSSKMNSTIVSLNDLRYGSIINPASTIFSVQATFSSNSELISFERKRPNPHINIMKEMEAMYDTLDENYQKKSIKIPSMASRL